MGYQDWFRSGLSLDGLLPSVTGLPGSFGVAGMTTAAPEPAGYLTAGQPTPC